MGTGNRKNKLLESTIKQCLLPGCLPVVAKSIN